MIRQLLLLHFLLSMLLWKQGTAKVDFSKALIWTTHSNAGDPIMNIYYGDPQSYIPALKNGSSGSYFLFSVPSGAGNIEFGVLDAPSSWSSVYFYFATNIYSSNLYVPNFGDVIQQIKVIPASKQVTGISIDWVSGLIFWSDALYQRICFIDVATYGLWHSVVDTNLTSPQDVIVYPQLSFVFWSDLGLNPKIERLDLTIDERITLLSSPTLHRPTTLAIDAANQLLFWLDTGASIIGSMNFDGSGVSLWTSSAFSTISSVVLYQNYCFFVSSAIPAIIHIYDRNQLTYQGNITGNGQGIIDINMWSYEQQYFASPCNTANGGCDHFCITINSTARRCLCAMGFFLAPNGVSCITKPSQIGKFLLVSDEEQKTIFQIDVDTGEMRALMPSFEYLVTATTYDLLDRGIYLFVTIDQTIVKIELDNSYTKTVIATNVGYITSMAMDSTNRRLFYVDSSYSTITMINLSTLISTTVLSEHRAIPTAIVLDTINGFMFWSDCRSQTIERSTIADASSERATVFRGLSSSCDTSFAIDFRNNVIYVGYANGSIAYAAMNGSAKIIYNDSSSSYTGLALDTRFLYIADSNKRRIQKLDRVSYQITNLTRILFIQPFSLLYYSDETDPPTMKINTTSTVAATPTTTTSSFIMPLSESTTHSTDSSGISSDAESGISFTTIVLVSVISGAVLIVAVIVTIGNVVCMKRRANANVNHSLRTLPYERPAYIITPLYGTPFYTDMLQDSLYSEIINPAFTEDYELIEQDGFSRQLYETVIPGQFQEIISLYEASSYADVLQDSDYSEIVEPALTKDEEVVRQESEFSRQLNQTEILGQHHEPEGSQNQHVGDMENETVA